MKGICILFLAFIPLVTFSQQRCGTYEYWQKLKQENPAVALEEERVHREANEWMQANRSAMGTNSIITIPVVVHVLYHTNAENISDAQIQSQIDALNIDFARMNQDTSLTPAPWKTTAANTGIQFCLAAITPDSVPTTGIERKYTDNTSWPNYDDMKMENQGGLAAWNRRYYMNIWVANLGGNFLGVTSPVTAQPYLDGMCISYKAFGRIGTHLDHRYNLGRTVTHEAGHWLGLEHIWGNDFGGCNSTDGINDTPNQADNTFGCPVFPVFDDCSDQYPGIMFMNYMDYTDDACMNMFTNGQAAKMNAVLHTFPRDSIFLNTSCNSPITVSVSIKLYPNPVTDYISIHTYFNTPATLHFSLKDIFGRELMQRDQSLSPYDVVSFNVTPVPSGVYMVTMEAGDYSFTQKVIVTHP